MRGAWRFHRGGQEVIGLFCGELEGNVLSLRWQERALPGAAQGNGYLVFENNGASFSGKWWPTASNSLATAS